MTNTFIHLQETPTLTINPSYFVIHKQLITSYPLKILNALKALQKRNTRICLSDTKITKGYRPREGSPFYMPIPHQMAMDIEQAQDICFKYSMELPLVITYHDEMDIMRSMRQNKVHKIFAALRATQPGNTQHTNRHHNYHKNITFTPFYTNDTNIYRNHIYATHHHTDITHNLTTASYYIYTPSSFPYDNETKTDPTLQLHFEGNSETTPDQPIPVLCRSPIYPERVLRPLNSFAQAISSLCMFDSVLFSEAISAFSRDIASMHLHQVDAVENESDFINKPLDAMDKNPHFSQNYSFPHISSPDLQHHLIQKRLQFKTNLLNKFVILKYPPKLSSLMHTHQQKHIHTLPHKSDDDKSDDVFNLVSFITNQDKSKYNYKTTPTPTHNPHKKRSNINNTPKYDGPDEIDNLDQLPLWILPPKSPTTHSIYYKKLHRHKRDLATFFSFAAPWFYDVFSGNSAFRSSTNRKLELIQLQNFYNIESFKALSLQTNESAEAINRISKQLINSRDDINKLTKDSTKTFLLLALRDDFQTLKQSADLYINHFFDIVNAARQHKLHESIATKQFFHELKQAVHKRGFDINTKPSSISTDLLITDNGTLYLSLNLQLVEPHKTANIYRNIPIPTYRNTTRFETLAYEQYSAFMIKSNHHIPVSQQELSQCLQNPYQCQLSSPAYPAQTKSCGPSSFLQTPDSCTYIIAPQQGPWIWTYANLTFFSTSTPITLNLFCEASTTSGPDRSQILHGKGYIPIPPSCHAETTGHIKLFHSNIKNPPTETLKTHLNKRIALFTPRVILHSKDFNDDRIILNFDHIHQTTEPFEEDGISPLIWLLIAASVLIVLFLIFIIIICGNPTAAATLTTILPVVIRNRQQQHPPNPQLPPDNIPLGDLKSIRKRYPEQNNPPPCPSARPKHTPNATTCEDSSSRTQLIHEHHEPDSPTHTYIHTTQPTPDTHPFTDLSHKDITIPPPPPPLSIHTHRLLSKTLTSRSTPFPNPPFTPSLAQTLMPPPLHPFQPSQISIHPSPHHIIKPLLIPKTNSVSPFK